MPCPPPTHMVSTPHCASRARNPLIKVVMIRAPVAPKGCPSAMAPPSWERLEPRHGMATDPEWAEAVHASLLSKHSQALHTAQTSSTAPARTGNCQSTLPIRRTAHAATAAICIGGRSSTPSPSGGISGPTAGAVGARAADRSASTGTCTRAATLRRVVSSATSGSLRKKYRHTPPDLLKCEAGRGGAGRSLWDFLRRAIP